ncbi:hypothetical protein C5S29_10365 [ANME-1 cluster archaeon GoMg3.2]|nr:hypothetical protein [ANME-1 cluster archaeon GoMg3.2]
MSTEEKFNEVKEPLLDLRIKGLLAAYQLRREELLRCVDNINRGIQVFLAGTFLLIAYAIYSEESLLFLVIPVVMFVLFNFLLYFFGSLQPDVGKLGDNSNLPVTR